MSSTGTRKQRSVQQRAGEAIIEADKEIISQFKIFAESSSSVAGLAGPPISNSPSSPGGNYLAKEGDSMIGPLALGSSSTISVEVDANNTIGIGPLDENLQYTSNVQLDDLQPNSAVLDIIANAAFDGQVLVLRTFAPTIPYTISQGTIGNGGNIQTFDSGDITLGDLQSLTLIFDENLIINANTGGTWRVISSSVVASSGGYHTIEEEGVAVIQRNTMNFISPNVTAVDDVGNLRTDITTDIYTWFANVDADNFALNNVSSIQITDSVGAVHGLLQGLAATGTRLTITSGETFQLFDNITSMVNISTASGIVLNNIVLNMNSNEILDTTFLESAAANLPGSGFIRMGTAEEIRMRNPANSDDLIITSGNDSIGNQSIIFQVASGNQLTVSELDIDVVDNDIINTGDVTPGSGAHQVGDSTDFYNQMHSQFFVPEAASVVTNRYALAMVGNTLYVNFDDTNADAGFSIYEEGFESFRFYHPTSTVNELHIGSSAVFTAGETYRIQMGENGNSSARIELTEGGDDLTLDRQGAATSFGVKLQSRSADRLYARFADVLLSVALNMNANDMTNVVDIKSNGGGGATTGTIGELITNDGGFNYFVRDTIAWESNANTEINFGSTGIDILTNGANDDIDITAAGTTSSINLTCTDTMLISISASTGLNFFINGATRFTVQDNALVSQVDVFVGTNYVDYTEITLPADPSANHGRMYARDVGGVSVPFWLDEASTETSMIGAGGGSQTPWLSDIDADGFDLNDLSNILFRTSTGAPTGGTISMWADAGGINFNISTSDVYDFRVNSVSEWTLNAGSFLPTADGVQHIGSASFGLDDIFTDEVRFTIGGVAGSKNAIWADAGGMNIASLGTDTIAFYVNGVEELQLQEDGELAWIQDGHVLIPQGTAFQMVAGNSNDRLEFINGTGASNASMVVEDFRTTWRTGTADTQAYILQIIQNNNTPADLRTIVNIDMFAENSSSVDTIYARISASSQDITNGTEDGLLQLGVVSGGTLVSGIDIEGSSSTGANDALIGFFGETPVVQQSVASDTLANLYTAMRNLGLVV